MTAVDIVRGPRTHRRGSEELECLRAAEEILTGLIERNGSGLVGGEKLRHVRDRLCDKIATLLAPPMKHCECCVVGKD